MLSFTWLPILIYALNFKIISFVVCILRDYLLLNYLKISKVYFNCINNACNV